MKIKSAMWLGMSVFLSGYAMAAAPWLHASDTLTIDAPASKVWATVKDFNALNTWHPAVASDEIVEGTNNKVGAVRLLTLKPGGTIKEKLLAFDDKGRTFKYAIVDGVLGGWRLSGTFIYQSGTPFTVFDRHDLQYRTSIQSVDVRYSRVSQLNRTR